MRRQLHRSQSYLSLPGVFGSFVCKRSACVQQVPCILTPRLCWGSSSQVVLHAEPGGDCARGHGQSAQRARQAVCRPAHPPPAVQERLRAAGHRAAAVWPLTPVCGSPRHPLCSAGCNPSKQEVKSPMTWTQRMLVCWAQRARVLTGLAPLCARPRDADVGSVLLRPSNKGTSSIMITIKVGGCCSLLGEAPTPVCRLRVGACVSCEARGLAILCCAALSLAAPRHPLQRRRASTCAGRTLQAAADVLRPCEQPLPWLRGAQGAAGRCNHCQLMPRRH